MIEATFLKKDTNLKTTDFLVIGAGVIGVNLALNLKKRYPDQTITLIDKELSCGAHASGRNSGVLHGGFYYSAESLKAKFTKEGNMQLTQYCLERNLSINRCGKLVVAQTDAELGGLDELLKRAQKNGVELNELTAREAREIEPRVKTVDRALYSPTTSSVDPIEILSSLETEALDSGIELHHSTAYLKRQDDTIITSRGTCHPGFVINTAGLYADKIARDFGFCDNYAILPFKGLYLYSEEPVGSVRTNIYPVPNLENPFLGVHYTIAVDGKIKVGPTAIPAFWREHYSGFTNFRINEFLEIITREAELFIRNSFGFRTLAFHEIQKYFRSRMVALAANLLDGVKPDQYRHWGKPGIRAQLFDLKNHKLEMDFRFEGDNRSFHVLNAVSPAFTCSMPFSQYLVDEIERLLN
jgi:L-2-hydroxyglutarate oxidase